MNSVIEKALGMHQRHVDQQKTKLNQVRGLMGLLGNMIPTIKRHDLSSASEKEAGVKAGMAAIELVSARDDAVAEMIRERIKTDVLFAELIVDAETAMEEVDAFASSLKTPKPF